MQLERVRRICAALSETWEKLSHGEPTFFVGKKVFAMCSIDHHNDGHVAVVIPAAIGHAPAQDSQGGKSAKLTARTKPVIDRYDWLG